MKDKNSHIGPIYSNIAYDDAFRTMEGECDDILIPFINYFFNETFDSNAVITRMRNESFIEHEDHSEEKRISDSHFAITQNGVRKIYHLECESKPYDGSILVRMFEYGTQIAISGAEVRTDEVHIKMPVEGLLLLRNSGRVPDNARVVLETPAGKLSYDVRIIKEADFSIDTIFEKGLFLLIPFYIFNFESQFDIINSDQKRINEMMDLYKNIHEKLEDEHESGRLSSRSLSVIIGMTHSVFCKLTSKHEALSEKVGEYMGGKILDMPDVALYKMGKAEGKAEGEEALLISMVCKKLSRGMQLERIAAELEEDVARIAVICNVAEKYAPDYDIDDIMCALHSR